MLNIWGTKQRLCDGISRREFLRVGSLGIGGLTLADLLRLRAAGPVRSPSSPKAVIMVYLVGGPSHIDMYDMKPTAPVEYRGEFKPIKTNVPGMDICELLPLQAKIADKLAIIRNLKFNRDTGHDPRELFTGVTFRDTNVSANPHPCIGSVVSRLRRDAGIRGALPSYVHLGDHVGRPGFLGNAYQPFVPDAKTKSSLTLARGLTAERLAERRALLGSFDSLRRELDNSRQELAGMDAFTSQAFAMLTASKVRDAFDVSKEPAKAREKYGKKKEYLLARRLVEAGVPVVTLTARDFHAKPALKQSNFCNKSDWDHHEHIFRCLRSMLPQYDQAIYALVSDLYERGLDKDVVVAIWGEMGRNPRIGAQANRPDGRDHWPGAGFALVSGGGLQMGQVIGATDPHGAHPKGNPYTPQNVLATLYHVLGIDADQTTLPDQTGRPVHLLEDTNKVKELV